MSDTRPSLAKQFGAEPPKAVRSDFWNPTLNIRFQEGHCMAFLYGQLVWMNYDREIGIILHFSSHTVKLLGRNLDKLYDELLELRLRQITVIDESRDLADDDRPAVYKALVEQVVRPGASGEGGDAKPSKRRSD